ncbi:MAG: S8 family serine peptidase [Desulfovermiculus sp.]|nr:S8 family serine peptidase [Desulfovermiculus sp.]
MFIFIRHLPLKFLLTSLIILLVFSCQVFAQPYTDNDHSSSLYVPGEVLIKFVEDIGQKVSRQNMILSFHNRKAKRNFPLVSAALVSTQKDESVQQAIRRLMDLDEVTYAEPNYKRFALASVPNDPRFASQWAHQNIHSTQAWSLETGDSSVVIAVADTGIAYKHEDIQNNMWNGLGKNFIQGTDDPLDTDGHGTYISGIIGAVGNNARGITGMNWNISLMALKFIDANNGGTVADEIQAIEYAVQRKVKIFNMSYGSYQSSVIERDAMAAAPQILFIASAGNESLNNDLAPLYPASYDLPNLISVAASTQSSSLASFSNYGPNTVHVAAPGVSILTTALFNEYVALSGTSMSTAYVSGLAGLVLAKLPHINTAQLKDRILLSADQLSELEGKSITGGKVNALHALTQTITGPEIFRINPNKGPTGSKVTILGANLKNTLGTVLFNNELEAPVLSWRNDKIVCEVPSEATSGSIQVVTSSGISNSLPFEITLFPAGLKQSFPIASTLVEYNQFIVLSNMFDHSITVNVQASGFFGEQILKIINLNAFEKRILPIQSLTINDNLMVIHLQSTDFFGASMFTFTTRKDQIKPIYAIPWGPESFMQLPPITR